MKAVTFLVFSFLSGNALAMEAQFEYFSPMLSFISEYRQALGGFKHIVQVENLYKMVDASAYQLVSQRSHQTSGVMTDTKNLVMANDTLFVIEMQDFQELMSYE